MSNFFYCPYCSENIETADASNPPDICPFCCTAYPNSVKKFVPGTEVGGYELRKILGVGGMGIVYLAVQKSVGREVAVKILPANLAANEEHCQRFFREVRTLAMIEHPNVVQAIEAGVDKDKLFFSMTYVKGRDIRKMIGDGKYFPEIEALRITLKTAEALRFVWDKHKVIHRDIKPGNIMISDDDNEVKLMDLGISKKLKDNVELTLAGMMVGSPQYVSPEQAKSLKDIDFRADMYSLGTTMYHMLAGEPPFNKEESLAILVAHLTEAVPDLRTKRKDISAETSALVRKMLAKDKNDRFASWDLFLQEVERICDKIEQREKSPSLTALQNIIETKSRGKNGKSIFLDNPRRIVIIALLFVIFLASLYLIAIKGAEDKKARNTVKLYNETLKFLSDNPHPLKELRTKLIMLARLQKSGQPAIAAKAKELTDQVIRNAREQKAKQDAEMKKVQIEEVAKKSYSLQNSGKIDQAIKLWENFRQDAISPNDTEQLERVKREIDYLQRLKKKKEAGLE